jgi:hypothetical protein
MDDWSPLEEEFLLKGSSEGATTDGPEWINRLSSRAVALSEE